MADASGSAPGVEALFPTTCWSRILPAGPREGEDGQGVGDAAREREALELLAARYWRPIHAWLRRGLRRADDEARDLTQDFFVWMLETGFVGKADPSRGRFRAFLKTALRHYVADADRRARAGKRGGGLVVLSLDGAGEPFPVPSAERTPDEVLDDAWRAEVVAAALADVEADLARSGRSVVFAVFRDYFLDPDEQTDYRSVAARHGVTTSDVSNHLRRAKQLYREHLRARVADTVAGPADLRAELAWLLGRSP